MIDLRVVAQTEARLFGGSPRVHKYFDYDETLSVEILNCDDSPQPGLTSYATIGMSSFDNGLERDGKPLRVELVMAAKRTFASAANGLSGCAFNVGHDDFQIRPRVVFPDIFSGYGEAVTTPHALMWFPFVWAQSFEPLVSDSERVEWLMVIPITSDEFTLVAERGADALIDRLEMAKADIFDLGRASVLASATPNA